jgi:hypothetical protein
MPGDAEVLVAIEGMSLINNVKKSSAERVK